MNINDILCENIIEKIYVNDIDLFEKSLEYDEILDDKIYFDKTAEKDVELSVAGYIIIKTDKNLIKISHDGWGIIKIIDKINDNIIDVSKYYKKDVIGKKIKSINIQNDEYIFTTDDNYRFIIIDYSDYLILLSYKFCKENLVDYEGLRKKGYLFEKYSLLFDYIKKIKPIFKDKKLKKILRLGTFSDCDINMEDHIYETDEPIALVFEGNSLFIDTADDSYMYFGNNICDFTETGYYYPRNRSWRLFPIFYKNFVGQKLKNIKVKKMKCYLEKNDLYYDEYNDKFESIELFFENNYSLKIWDSHTWMQVQEINNSK